jgi:hypothetical protein
MTRIVLAFGLAAALLPPQAHAHVIPTETAHAQDERARVKALVERPELGTALSTMGITPWRLASTRWPTPRCFSSPAG